MQCQIDSIQSCRTPRGVQEALVNLPKDLFSTYERILSKINTQGPDVVRIVQTTLCWLVAAVRPLKLTEVNEAVTIKTGSLSLDEDLGVFTETDIVEICSSLVNYDESKGVISLSHFTVQVRHFDRLHFQGIEGETLGISHKRAFENHPLQWIHYLYSTHSQLLTVQALTYLLLDDFDKDPCRDLRSYIERTEGYPLYEYAAFNWFKHLSIADNEDEEIFALFHALLQNRFNQKKKMNFRQAEHMTHGDVIRTDEAVSGFIDVSPLCYPVFHEHLWVIRRIAREDPEMVNTDLWKWGPPLILAVWGNQLRVTELLLDLGADVNRTTFDFRMNPGAERNAPFLAAELGYEEILTLFLQRGANIHVKLAPRNETILHAACAFGAPNPVRQLLSCGADVEVKGTDGAAAIHHAAMVRSLDTVQLLVDAGCNVHEVTNSGKTALSIAMDLRDPLIIQYLLDHGADISDMQDVPINQLGWAASHPWYPKVVELLESRAWTAAPRPTYSALDVLKVEFILCHWLSLPSGIAKTILDYAQCWIFKKAFVQFSEPFVVYDGTPHIPSIVLPIPGRAMSSVRKIVFTTRSHDQGKFYICGICLT